MFFGRLVAVLAAVVAIAACGDPAPDQLLVEAPTPDTRFERDRSMAMSARLVDELELDSGMVIVPSDEAVLGLDADGLADLLAGGLADVVADAVIGIDHGPDPEAWPGQLDDGSGPALPIELDDGIWTVDGHPVVDAWVRDGVTIVVIDGVLGS